MSVDDLEWVAAEQQSELDELAGQRGDWRVWLPDQLDEWWPEWRASSPDILTPYLDSLLPTLLSGQPAETDADVGDPEPSAAVTALEWVTMEQSMQLGRLTDFRGDWHAWLPYELDTFWQDWPHSHPDILVPWLDSLLPTLLESADQTSDAADLTWVTAEQASQLDELTELRGDWREWLPTELDERGTWRDSSPDVLVPWLDSIIPLVVLPGTG